MNTQRSIAVIVAVSFLGLTACGATAVRRYGHDGEPEFFIDCSNKPMTLCYRKALSACPQGYYLVESKETPQGSKSGSVFGRLKRVGATKADNEIKWKNQLIVRCK